MPGALHEVNWERKPPTLPAGQHLHTVAYPWSCQDYQFNSWSYRWPRYSSWL